MPPPPPPSRYRRPTYRVKLPRKVEDPEKLAAKATIAADRTDSRRAQLDSAPNPFSFEFLDLDGSPAKVPQQTLSLETQQRNLQREFSMQWTRLRTSMTEMLQRERARLLGGSGLGALSIGCRQLAAQQQLPNARAIDGTTQLNIHPLVQQLTDMKDEILQLQTFQVNSGAFGPGPLYPVRCPFSLHLTPNPVVFGTSAQPIVI
mmetsp:Transcript_18789/g.45041  ORF Transcript_18789/g.45041 Transcript_18789/m.45041 type:complete len:204 (+) Transcript_18789:3-614(+)